MYLKVSNLNGEQVEFIYRQENESSELFKVWMNVVPSTKAIAKITEIMGWRTMPYERVLQHLREGFLVNMAEISKFFN